MMPMDRRPSREDVLMDFATAQDGAAGERLEAFVRRFPEYEAELVELAEELGWVDWDDAPDCAAVDEAMAQAALERFARVEAGLVSTPATPAAAAADPFAALDPRGFRRAATAFGASVMFIGRLKDRLIQAEDLTTGFVARLAQVLDTRADALAAFLSGPPRVTAGMRFKADGKPQAMKKQSLAEALDSSNLTAEQKRHLSSL